jgi:hypothetical protein
MASFLQLAGGTPPPCPLQAVGPHRHHCSPESCHQLGTPLPSSKTAAAMSHRCVGESPTSPPCQVGSPTAPRPHGEDRTEASTGGCGPRCRWRPVRGDHLECARPSWADQAGLSRGLGQSKPAHVVILARSPLRAARPHAVASGWFRPTTVHYFPFSLFLYLF